MIARESDLRAFLAYAGHERIIDRVEAKNADGAMTDVIKALRAANLEQLLKATRPSAVGET
ncbi:MAG: hypothetical protein ABSD03_14270 [Vulcanimicrobiaceae bacterium]|jgi:hypothetical protein